MRSRRKVFIFSAGLILLLSLGVWISSRVLALSNQIQGGQVVTSLLNAAGSSILGPIACDLPPITDQIKLPTLSHATKRLEEAGQQNPNGAQTYLLLGRAYCLQGNPDSAAQAYQRYVNLRPGNPLGHLELSFAYESLCREKTSQPGGSPSECADPEFQAQIAEEWRKAGVVAGQFRLEGDKAFSVGRYEEAARWYSRAVIFGDASSIPVFQYSIAALAAGKPLPEATSPDISITQVRNGAKIEGEAFRWLLQNTTFNLKYGDSLADHSSQIPGVGVMWWSGNALSFIHVEEQGVYRILFRVKSPPKNPQKFQVSIDLVPVGQFVIDISSQEWQEGEVATILQPGDHILGLYFLEDNGDAYIDWASFEKIR